MAAENDNCFQITIKEELEFSTTEDLELMDIKEETDVPEPTENHADNPFENVQLEIKQILEKEISYLEKAQNNAQKAIKTEVEADVITDEIDSNLHVNVKEEVQTEESLVTYDYPNFDETESMDSNEAVALGNVEACLHDEVNVKREEETIYNEHQKEDFNPTSAIQDLLTERNVDVTSAILETVPQVPCEIQLPDRPVKIEGHYPKHTNDCNPGLNVTQARNNPPLEDGESFQLNSITGNVLSLEQEAYGLIKAPKLKKKLTLTCLHCPKIYTNKHSFNTHLRVHQTIEKRAMGIIKGKLTRLNNQKKKQENLETPEEIRGTKSNQNSKKDNNYRCTCGKSFQRRSRMETCLRSHNMFESKSNSVACVSCSKQFKNKDELALHRKRLHRKKFPCKFCPTDYDTRKELFKHLQIHQKVQLMEYKVISEVMKGKQKLRCFMCSKSWAELSELKNHVMNTHKGPYVCPHCKNTFPKIIDFGNHTKTYHPEVEGQSVLDVLEAFSRLVQAWKCEECELQFLEPDKLALHQIEKHSPDLNPDSQVQCPDCRRVFISQKGLTSHRRIHHNTETTEEAKEEEKGIMCLECRKVCKDINALTSHMRLHSPDRKYPCKFCDFRFATPEKRKTHAEIHTGDMRYVCFICEYQCSSENRLKQHKISLKHANMREYLLTGKPLLEESTSKEEKKKEVNVKKRKKDRVQEREEKVSDSELSADTEVSCDICGDKFRSQRKMLKHKLTHPFIEFPNEDTPSRIFFK